MSGSIFCARIMLTRANRTGAFETAPVGDATTITNITQNGDHWGSSTNFKQPQVSPVAQRSRSPRPVQMGTSRLSSPLASPSLGVARSTTPSESDAGERAAPQKAVATSTIGMTKEEKAAEMARRKEERRQVRGTY